LARHRQPREKAKANGAFDEHPGRYGEEEPPKHSEPLGDPPKFLTAAQKKDNVNYLSHIFLKGVAPV